MLIHSCRTALSYCVKTSVSVTLIHSCRLHNLVEGQRNSFTQLCQYLNLSNVYPQLQNSLSYCVKTSVSVTLIHSCRLHNLVEGQRNSFILLRQDLYLSNAYPHLQTVYTSRRSTKSALLYSVGASFSVILVHSCRLLIQHQLQNSFTQLCQYLYLSNVYPQLQNSFILLCQNLCLSNAHPQLQTA